MHAGARPGRHRGAQVPMHGVPVPRGLDSCVGAGAQLRSLRTLQNEAVTHRRPFSTPGAALEGRTLRRWHRRPRLGAGACDLHGAQDCAGHRPPAPHLPAREPWPPPDWAAPQRSLRPWTLQTSRFYESHMRDGGSASEQLTY